MGNCVNLYPCLIKCKTKKNSSKNLPQGTTLMTDTKNNKSILINRINSLAVQQKVQFDNYNFDIILDKEEEKIDKTVNEGDNNNVIERVLSNKNENSEKEKENENENEEEEKEEKENINKLSIINDTKISNDYNLQKIKFSNISESHAEKINVKYSRLKSFHKQLSTEKFLRAKTKGDQIINSIPKHLGPKQISWGGSSFGRSINNNPIAAKCHQYLKRVTENTENKNVKRLSIIKEVEAEEDNNKGNSVVVGKNNLTFKYNINLVNELKNINLIINNLSEEQIINLSLIIVEYEINPDMDVFCKGELGNSLFILESGKIKIYDENPNKFISVENEYAFGEICMFNNNDVHRRYSITTLTKTKIFILEKEKFNFFLLKENISLNSVDIEILKSVELLKKIPEEELIILSRLCFLMNEEEVQSNKNSVIFITFTDFFNLDSKTIHKKNCIKVDINIKNCKKYLIIPVHSMFELMGIDYKRKLILYIFEDFMKIEENFIKYIKVNQINTAFYSIFKLKCINKDSSTRIRFADKKNFMVLLLSGNVKFYNDEKLIADYNSVKFIDTKKIPNKTKMIFKLNSVILYSNYDEIISKSKEIQLIFNHKLNQFRKFTFFNLLNDEEIISLLNIIKEKKYKKDTILINSETKCEVFYFILSGEVKHKYYNDVTVVRYGEGDCFGEVFLLDGEGEFFRDSYVVVSSENLITLEIPKNEFFNLLQKPQINDFIKVKMCLEDKSILLSDLFYLSFLGKGKFGNVFLVHNGIFLYAIKVISRNFINNINKAVKYLQNENNILKLLNFQFIVKLVKTFKTVDYFFFLMEYSTGSQLDVVLDLLPSKKNTEIVRFYGGTLFLILDYLNKKKIIHRDIKPNNIMVDTTGYLKLIDFGAAKKIPNGYAKTIIGTPFYMAPEVVEGKNYSFSCDYYSVGICLYYMYYKKYPFGMGQSDVYLIYQEILKKPICFSGLNNQNNLLNDLIKKLLDKEPALRISSLYDVKANPFFKDFDWVQLFAKKMKAPYVPTQNKDVMEQYLRNCSKPFEDYIEDKRNVLNKYDLKQKLNIILDGSDEEFDDSWIDGF